ncbi:MAG: PAS domain-containing protein [Syntrophales bacterium]
MPDAKIMIVEDEGIQALDMQNRLTSLGYPVPNIASSGEEAIGLAEEARPDLILMDIMLPGEIDGVTAAEKIHARFDIPVIYITAYADEETLRRAKVTEPYGYIVKPFKERELHITIDMALYKSKLERKLKESERRWATTLKSIGDAVIATDEKGMVTFMNAVAEDLMGWKLAEIQNRKMTDVFNIINRDTRQPAENPVVRVLLEGAVVGLANHTLLIARDGREIPIDDSAAPIKDDQGRIVGVILVFRDITERDRAEQALLLARDEWERTFNTIPDLIAILDKEHRVVRTNQAMADRLGMAPDQCIGARCYEVIHGLSQPPEFCPHALTCRDGGEHVAEVHDAVLGGDFLVSTTPLCDERDRLVGSIHVARNITERKRMEEELRQKSDHLEAANKELEAFTYSVTHDLRAPLRAIEGYSRMLVRGAGEKLAADTLHKLQVIRDNVRKMGQLIDDLLTFSRFGRVTMSPVPLDMENLAGEVWDELCGINPERSLNLRRGSLPPVFGDRSLIRQVFANLLSNAIKFTRNKEAPVIEIGSSRKEDGTCYYVKDNGAGFDMRFYDKLFTVFQRLHGDNEFEGTGVGLAIVHRIIHRHGGRVWAEAEVDRGASFYFCLPADDSPAKDRSIGSCTF